MIINLKRIIGKGYSEFWNFKGRYRVVKGGRGSKKSATCSLYYIYMMMAYYYKYGVIANVLIIRKHYRTLQESVYNQLIWAINRLKAGSLFKVYKSPLKIVFKPSGGQFIFRGLDDPLKITSIKPEVGHLCWVFFEEAYEITNEEDFNKVDMSIRGILPKELFYQLTLVMNPWSADTWIKKRFFDKVDPLTGLSEDGEILAITRNYDVNEWLDKQYLKMFEIMKRDNPRRYKIEGLGEWGQAEGLIYENWEVKEFDANKLYNYRLNGYQNYKKMYGLDFGFSIDPTAFVALLANEKERVIYIYKEFGGLKMTNDDIARELRRTTPANAKIICDSAEPKSIEELYRLGINAQPCRKGRDSISHGIQKLQDYKIIVHPDCVNVIKELHNYRWDIDKDGKTLNKPVDDFNHWMDALRYATENLSFISMEW